MTKYAPPESNPAPVNKTDLMARLSTQPIGLGCAAAAEAVRAQKSSASPKKVQEWFSTERPLASRRGMASWLLERGRMMKLTFSFRSMALLLASAFFTTLTTQAATLCVGPAATGNGSGSDWSNLKAWSSTPVRGDIWYLVDGAYTGKSLGVAASGSTLITIKKATVADHGGIINNWSDTMGDGQAAFSGQINFTTSNWLFDGQTGGGPGSWNSGFGFKITVTDDATALIMIGYSTAVSGVTIRHVEFQGKGSVSNTGGGTSNDAVSIWNGSNITVSYAWMHGIGRCPFFTSANNLVVEYVYVQSFYASGPVHAELASIWGFGPNLGDHTFRYNLFTHVAGTGGLMWDNNSNPSSHLYVYGNVFYKPSGDTWEASNGLIGGWTGANGEKMYNVLVYNNTFVNCDQQVLATLPTIYSGCQAMNNLFYNCPVPDFSRFPTHDYNHFINTGGTQSEAHGTSVTSGDPFTGYVNLDFALKANTTSGGNLGSPYNVDPLGRIRSSWTRGAYEYGLNTNPVVSVSPTSLNFGSVPAGTSRDLSFTVQNGGAGTLTGNASAASPFSIISGGTYSLGAGQSQIVTVRYSPTNAGSDTKTVTFTGGGGASPSVSGLSFAAVSSGLSFEYYAGTISAPFVANSGGYLSQNILSGVADGGRAVYLFSITNAGSYVIQALVNAPDLTANSFYVNVDAEPQDPNMAWDILPPTTGFEPRVIGRRGNGTADDNQFDRQIFDLTAGTHQLIIIGREPNTQLVSLSFLKLPPPPPNFRRLVSLP